MKDKAICIELCSTPDIVDVTNMIMAKLSQLEQSRVEKINVIYQVMESVAFEDINSIPEEFSKQGAYFSNKH